MKMIAEKRTGMRVTLYTEDKLTYIPAGWHKPAKYYTFTDMHKGQVRPAHKRPALVSAPNAVMNANNYRVVDEQTQRELEEINRQINVLRYKYNKILEDRYLTFRLVTKGDIQTNKHTTVYNTQKEAEAAYAERLK